jgi:nicotinamide mononucleotide (NMN) deamidase PncC
VTADLARHTAAQSKADAVIRAVAESPDGLLLRVSVTDVETGQRLATGFVTYQPDAPVLRIVGEAP